MEKINICNTKFAIKIVYKKCKKLIIITLFIQKRRKLICNEGFRNPYNAKKKLVTEVSNNCRKYCYIVRVAFKLEYPNYIEIFFLNEHILTHTHTKKSFLVWGKSSFPNQPST